MTEYLLQAFIYLCAAVLMVPLASRLGLGSVLGYLLAGVIIGPLLGLVGQETVQIQHFAEFGVVMMLFLVGLELEPRSIWMMRHRLLGLGGLQILLTTVSVTGICLLVGIDMKMAIAIGLILALSSTAIVLQTFQEKRWMQTDGGRNAFSVLLFQDIAVIPMLALIPLLAMTAGGASSGATADAHTHGLSLVAGLPAWLHAIVVLGAIAAVIVAGHYLSRPLLRFVAASGLREIFTTTALMLVIGIAVLMGLVGLSPALGTFLAGVVLANSEFRHELESNIEPFKGLLLGLFFITVGAGIQTEILLDRPGTVFGLAVGLMLVKALILWFLAWVFKIRSTARWLFSLSLAQAGEFGFVLLSFSQQTHVLPDAVVEMLSLVVAVSMFLTPALFLLFEHVIRPRYGVAINEREADSITEQGCVIIAGIGRFGQVVNRLLVSNNYKTVVLDNQIAQVEMMRRVRVKSYFGDATRQELLETAGIKEAALLVIAMDERAQTINLTHLAKRYYPKVKILARAFDRGHAYQLRAAGADVVVSETFYSAMHMGREALMALGLAAEDAETRLQQLLGLERDYQDELYARWCESQGENGDLQAFRELFMELESMLATRMQQESHNNNMSTRK